jgi:hypothetical protein
VALVTVVELLTSAFEEVANTPTSMMKLARAATSRPNVEREWVYEIDGSKAFEGEEGVIREASLGGRLHADMRIDGSYVELKSTYAHYARSKALWPPSARTGDTAAKWLGPDIGRMCRERGLFVLLVTTVTPPAKSEFRTLDIADLREEALDRYERWLWERPEVSPLARGRLLRVHAGHGAYASRVAHHDALIVNWVGARLEAQAPVVAAPKAGG